jgi:hypothetical protein
MQMRVSTMCGSAPLVQMPSLQCRSGLMP